MSQPDGLKAHLRRLGLAYLILLSSLILTVAASMAIRKTIRARQFERFKTTGEFVFDTSGHDLAYFLLLLQGLRGLFVESIPEPAEVRAYFKSIEIRELEKKEALEGVGLIWRVTPKNQAEFVNYFTSRGLTNILSEWRASPEDTFPIVDFQSIHPRAYKVVGWDVGTDPVRRAILRKAFETGEAQMTPKLQLNLPKSLNGKPGFIVYLPIFDGGVVPETLEERKAKFLGYVFGSFDSERFFRGIMAKREPILNLEVFDGEMAPENLLYDQDKVFHPQAPPVQFASTIGRYIFGRRWTFYFSEAPEIWSPAERTLPQLVLWGGIVMSFCFFGLVFAQVRGRTTAELLNERLRKSAQELKQSKEEVESNLALTKKAEEGLAHSLSLQLATLESTADGIIVVDRKGKIVSYNQRFLSMWAIPEEFIRANDRQKALACAMEQIIEAEKFQEKIKDLYANPEAESHDELLFKDGRVFERYSRPQKIGDQIVGRVWSFRDVTDRKEAEQSLVRSELQYRDLVETSHDLIWSVDAEERWTFVNQAARRIYGYEPSEMLGRSFSKFQSPEYAQKDLEVFALIKEGKPAFQYVTQQIRKDGNPVWLSFNAMVVSDEAGNTIGAKGTARDITEKLKLEAELLKTSKLESIGLLAGGIAHDFNNILTAIIGNLSLMKTAPSLPAEVSLGLEEVQKASSRARDLTQQLLTFAKGGAPIKQSESIAGIIRDSAEFALHGSKVRPEFDFAPDLSAVEVDAGQISQVIHNLVINSKQAMAKGGIVRISAANKEVSAGDNLPLKPGRYAVVSVRDHGNGIHPQHLSKIFDPYFTTKSSGTGLGLATAYSIIKRHDGLITVESEPGKGTVFHIYLHISTRPPVQRKTHLSPLEKGTGRILAMDDEPAIRAVLAAMLRHLGYEIITVSEGSEAIAEYRNAFQNGHRYDVVIMDLTVPGGLGGLEVVRELLQFDPSVKAIVSSGYSSDPIMSEYRAYGFVGVVEKPYRIDQIARLMREVLNSTSGSVGNG
jgi:PAS domain S-box-containing protein